MKTKQLYSAKLKILHWLTGLPCYEIRYALRLIKAGRSGYSIPAMKVYDALTSHTFMKEIKKYY